jgi:hypothetical protein
MKSMTIGHKESKNRIQGTMNVMIIYDKFDSAAKARALLEGAAHHLDESTRCDATLMRLDILKLPPAGEAALAGAEDESLRNRISSSTIVAFKEVELTLKSDRGETSSFRWVPSLMRMTHQAGLSP